MKYGMKYSFILVLFTAFLPGCGSSQPGGASGPTGGIVGGTPGGGNQTSPGTLDGEESAFLTLINAYRVQNGLTPLQVSATLTQASQWMSEDQASKNYLGHTDSLGRDPSQRITAFGFSASGSWGENVAAGNSTAADTFTQWKNSPAHNANMLGAGYTLIGIGRAYGSSSSYGWYWTTDFASKV